MPIKSTSWLAGYLEGEGTFLAPPPSAPTRYRIVTKATDKDVIEHVADMFGCKTGIQVDPRNPNWDTLYDAVSNSRKAIVWMNQLYPYMGQRRQSQIERAIGYIPDRVMPPLNKFEWLIGLLEGEGSFIAGPPSAPNRPHIQIQMTDLDVLERAAVQLGAKVNGPFERKNPNAKLQYAVRIRGKKAADRMKEMRPHMGIRRQGQIDTALENFEYRYGFGSTHSRSKLTEDDVRYIKREVAEGRGSTTRLAREFGVDPKTITFIKQGKTWGHVTLDDDETR